MRADAGAQLAAREDSHACCVGIRPSVGRDAEGVIVRAATAPGLVRDGVGGWLHK